MLVYIASPYTLGDVAQNVRESVLVAEQVRAKGHLPFTPLLSHFWNLMSPHERAYWMDMDFEWVLRADCVLRLPGESEGADQEVRLAEQHGKPVYHSVEDLPVERSYFWCSRTTR